MARTVSFSPGIPEGLRWARRHSTFRRRDQLSSFVARCEDRKVITVNATDATRILISVTTNAPAGFALYLLHREPPTAVCQGSLATGMWYKSRYCSLSWHRRRANREDEHTRRDQNGTSAVSGIADFGEPLEEEEERSERSRGSSRSSARSPAMPSDFGFIPCRLHALATISPSFPRPHRCASGRDWLARSNRCLLGASPPNN
jgi:hypothetical protein